MDNYFDEKSIQVEPSSLNAFGVSISSRYGRAHELVEMLNFTRGAALENVAHYVNSVFYDSKADLCTFEFNDAVTRGDVVEQALRKIARETIAQFDWFGTIDHGEPMYEAQELLILDELEHEGGVK